MKTIYGKDRNKRVIVGPHGAYIAQHHQGGVGQKRRTFDGVVHPHYDPWTMIKRPTFDLNLAKLQAGIES